MATLTFNDAVFAGASERLAMALPTLSIIEPAFTEIAPVPIVNTSALAEVVNENRNFDVLLPEA